MNEREFEYGDWTRPKNVKIKYYEILDEVTEREIKFTKEEAKEFLKDMEENPNLLYLIGVKIEQGEARRDEELIDIISKVIENNKGDKNPWHGTEYFYQTQNYKVSIDSKNTLIISNETKELSEYTETLKKDKVSSQINLFNQYSYQELQENQGRERRKGNLLEVSVILNRELEERGKERKVEQITANNEEEARMILNEIQKRGYKEGDEYRYIGNKYTIVDAKLSSYATKELREGMARAIELMTGLGNSEAKTLPTARMYIAQTEQNKHQEQVIGIYNAGLTFKREIGSNPTVLKDNISEKLKELAKSSPGQDMEKQISSSPRKALRFEVSPNKENEKNKSTEREL